MSRLRSLALVGVALALGACGGTADLTCDEVQYYQTAVLTDRVVAPDDLDQLDPNREMPMPEASPRPPREPGHPLPQQLPRINRSNSKLLTSTIWSTAAITRIKTVLA